MSSLMVSTAEHKNDAAYSLFQLLHPEAIADPYPLYRKLREFEPVHWDCFLNSWVVTSYAECLQALQTMQASRTPSCERLEAMGLQMLSPYTKLMMKQLLFIDPPSHTRIRSLCSVAFTPRRIECMRQSLTTAANELIDSVSRAGTMDLVTDFARPFPARVLAELIGLPAEDADRLLSWVSDVSELLGNFEHDPDRVEALVESVEELRSYLTEKLNEHRSKPGEGILPALMRAEVDGEPQLTDDEIIANVILMCGGGLEEPANLICVGMLSMLERPGAFQQLGASPTSIVSGVEELLRFNAPTQHTGRVAPKDMLLGGKEIRKGQAVTIVVAAANRDPLRFQDPDTLNLLRTDNRHLAFGWGAHYCLGAPLARMVGQIAFTALFDKLDSFALTANAPRWREMVAMRGLTSMPITFAVKPSGGTHAR